MILYNSSEVCLLKRKISNRCTTDKKQCSICRTIDNVQHLRYMDASFKYSAPRTVVNIPMNPQRHVRLITFLLFVLVAFTPALAQEAPLNGFDDYVNKALREWEVPGLAIAIVKDDRIVLAKGYGVRKLGDPTPVSERTLFAIGSSSKAFTAAAKIGRAHV